MTEQINIKINLARHFQRVHDYRKALGLLREAERLALQTPDYPYWGELTELLDSTEQLLNNMPQDDQDLSDGGEEYPTH